jgi:uncharacterized surface protein with fasciclin (FAS1) repeats
MTRTLLSTALAAFAAAFLLGPATSALACGVESKSAANAAQPNIVETAESAGTFATLLAALRTAELDSVLSGDGPFTVFAPTDEAFAKLPAGTVESLLKPENRDQLIAILTYHVVPGRVSSDQVAGLDSAATVQGESLSIRVIKGQVRVDDARVVTADIEASNGLIHVIDAVVLPG